jgi:radical SAM protein with 4Fe4S-binding SPASM domain
MIMKGKMQENQWNLLRYKGAQEDEVFVGPQNTEIYLTNACALSCLFCPYHFCGDEKYGNARKDIDFGTFRNIVDNCETLKVESISFAGEGDPFSHLEIGEMIAYVKDKNMRLDINTHGLFGQKLFPAAQRVDCLHVNIPGVDEASYKNSQFDRKNCFEQVAGNVQRLSQCKEQRPELDWIYVVTKDSFPYLSRVLLTADKLGFDRVTFKMATVHEDIDHLAIVEKYLKDFKKEIAAALRADAGIKAKSNILYLANKVKSMVFYDECKRDMPNNSRVRQGKSIYYEGSPIENPSCLVGWHFAIVDLNGDVLFCFGNLQTVVGNVYEESFKDIWNGQRAKQMRFEMKYNFGLEKDFFRECRNCPYLSNKHIRPQ